MLRALGHPDLERLMPLRPDGWHDIRPFFSYYIGSEHCRAVGVERDGELVAVGAVVLHGHTAWLAHIITRADHRRRGLGQQVTGELGRISEAEGRQTQLLIATPMGEPVYRRLGFEPTGRYLFFDQQVLPGGAEVRPLGPDDVDAVLALDRWASGESRRHLLIPHAANGWAVGDLRGFYLPTLGEGLVIARDEEAGRALLGKRNETAQYVVVPEGSPGPDTSHFSCYGRRSYSCQAVFSALLVDGPRHTCLVGPCEDGLTAARSTPSRRKSVRYPGPAARWLESLGVEVVRTGLRMARGIDPVRTEALYNRIGGHVG